MRRQGNFCAILVTAAMLLGHLGCAVKSRRGVTQSSMDNRLQEIQRDMAKMRMQLEAMRNDVMILQDQMDSTRIQVQKIILHGAKAKRRAQTTKARGGTFRTQQKKAPANFVSFVSKEDPRKGDKKPEKDPMTLYHKAFSFYEKKKLNDALETFEEFVQQYPEHPYADNAVYWMGEAYYDQKEYILAITEFRRVLNRYETSNKAADALLKIGYCFERLDDRKQATRSYRDVVEQYPYTSAGKKAAEKLARLEQR